MPNWTRLEYRNQADFNNDDGSDEIVAGYRGKLYGVCLYDFHEGKWNREPIDAGEMSAASCTVGDLDGNGRPAIACIGSATHNLKVYRLTALDKRRREYE